MKILLVVPLDRTQEAPRDIPTQAGILSAIADAEGHKVDVMDLNALRELTSDEAIVKTVMDTVKADEEGKDFDMVWVDSGFRTFAEARRVIRLLHPRLPETLMVMGGSAATSAPNDVLKLAEGLDVAVIGEQEEALLDVIARAHGQRWEPVKGIAYHWQHGLRRNELRPPAEDLDKVPFPNYFLMQMARYFQFSQLPFCRESMASRRRLSFSWSREHVDRQGKTVVRFPSPKRAALNIASARFKYGVDFATLLDEDIMSSVKWLLDFLDEYMQAGPDDEGLHDVVPFSCWADPGQVARNPEIVRRLKDAGCRAVQIKVDSSEPGVDAIRRAAMEQFKRVGMPVILRFIVGAPTQNLSEITGMVSLGLSDTDDSYEVVPANLYPDGPYFSSHKQEILAPYAGDLAAFLLDQPKVSPMAFQGLDFAAAAAATAMVRAKDIQGLLRLAHLKGTAHSDSLKAQCPICNEMLVEA